MPASSPADAGQGAAGPCRIPPPQTGNAPLRLRLAAHPPPLAGAALGVGLPPIKPPLQGAVSPQATEGCGTLPCQYPSGAAWRRRTGPRRAKSPALHRTRGRAATQNQQPHVRPDGGPTQGSPLCPGARGPAVPGSASRLPCIVGRAFTPAAGPCGSARPRGRCQHRPLRTRGKVLPGLAGYLRRQPAMHPSGCALRRIHLPLQGRLWRDCRLKGSPVRGCGVERRLRRRKLFLIRQTAVTPFIIACSAIESIGPPFAHRSGLCRFAATPRSQNASMLQHAPHDAGTANR